MLLICLILILKLLLLVQGIAYSPYLEDQNHLLSLPSKCLVITSLVLVTSLDETLTRHFDGSYLRSKLGINHRFEEQTKAISMMCSATSECAYFFVGEPNKFDRDFAGLIIKVS